MHDLNAVGRRLKFCGHQCVNGIESHKTGGANLGNEEAEKRALGTTRLRLA